mmetsp:Transcript_36879/g.82962  ORF Transcript_36879/g.82962 Transcript_36879/m.82962 type:complete len:386 (+) Transcript_36879:176-1333(+)
MFTADDEKVDENHTVSTGRLTPCSSDDFSAASAATDAQQAPSRGRPSRRSIFSSYWKKSELKQAGGSTGPSYLGVHSFATFTNRSPTCVSTSLSLPPTSILRRKGSGREGTPVCPPPLLLETSETEIETKQSVRFNPRITVREQSLDSTEERESRTWYDERDICRFLSETVFLSRNNHINAIRNFSPVSIREHRDIATNAGIKKPVLMKNIHREEKPLFSGSFLAASPDDIIVHEGSKLFFLILAHEVNKVFICDSSRSCTKLFRHTILSMFPKARIDVANSGEASLDLIGSNKHQYDIIIAEERLDSTGQLSGSELLRLLRRMQERDALMVGVSSSMSEDCEALRKRGTADVLWGKPIPSPSCGLRRTLLNALLTKRGAAVCIC